MMGDLNRRGDCGNTFLGHVIAKGSLGNRNGNGNESNHHLMVAYDLHPPLADRIANTLSNPSKNIDELPSKMLFSRILHRLTP